MTTERFTLEEFGLNFIVNDNGRNLTAKQTVECLNNLHEENEELKARKYPIPIEEMDKYLNYGDIKDLRYANEVIESQRKEIRKIHEENQKLKKLNIPIDEIKDTVSDYRGRIIGVYYND